MYLSASKCTIVMPKGFSNELRSKFDHKLDPKNRIAIPSEWAADSGCPILLLEAKKEGLTVIKALTQDKFQEYVTLIQESDKTPVIKDILIGKLYADCVETTINAQGKMLIPRKMCDRSELTGEVKLVGRGSYFEIWQPERYEEYERLELARLEEVNADFGIF